MKKTNALMMTFGLAGGSFTALRHLAELPGSKLSFIIVGLGNYDKKHKEFKVHNIPFFRYDGITGHLSSKYIFFGVLLQIPLFIFTLILIFFYRPKIMVFNGLTTMIPILPVVKLLGIKVVLSFRSWWDKKRFIRIEPIVKWFGNLIDLAYVNSTGTKNNLSSILPSEKIMVVEHHADRIYFKKRNRELLRKKHMVDDKTVFLYVGRIDEEKHCQHIFEIANKLRNNKDILFMFIGTGLLKNELIKLENKLSNIKYLGFVNSPKDLVDMYTMADIIISNSDETYLARPAVESLACGTPIMIPILPAMGEKIREGNARVPKSLVPDKIGWLIDIKDTNSVIKLITQKKFHNQALAKRPGCKSYAKMKYYLDPNVKLLKKLELMT